MSRSPSPVALTRISRFVDPESRLTGRLSATGQRISVGSTRTSAASVITASGRISRSIRLPQNPTSEQKHRLVFDELDLKNNQNLAAAGFHRTFKQLNLNFSAQTVDDLYRHMDRNKDGVVSFSEFLNWAAHYPFLIDALYGRLREQHERNVRLEELEAHKRLLDEAQREERVRNENAARSKEALEKQLTFINALQQELNKRADALKRANKDVHDAKRSCDESASHRTTQERELEAAKQVEKEAHGPVKEAADERNRVEDLLETRGAELRRAQEVVTRCEAQLTEARRELAQCQIRNEEVQNELDFIKECEGTVLSILEDAKANVRQQEEELHEIDLVLLRRHEDLREVEDRLAEHEEETQVVMRKREEEEAKIHELRDASNESTRYHNHAIQHVDEAYQKMIALENNLASYLAERQRLEEAEKQYLDEEVGLREVRVRLEQRAKDLSISSSNLAQASRSRSITSGGSRHLSTRKSVL